MAFDETEKAFQGLTSLLMQALHPTLDEHAEHYVDGAKVFDTLPL